MAGRTEWLHSVATRAVRWYKNGDHPADGDPRLNTFDPATTEGKVVRYFRRPGVDGEAICMSCGVKMHEHGWIDSGGNGQTVHPGDYILNDATLRFRCISPAEFDAVAFLSRPE